VIRALEKLGLAEYRKSSLATMDTQAQQTA
jgi:hypothetical protein